ncbi:MAG: ABC transporter substrate-binding protein, partial [Anaerolineae bacterium]|nr:ABC transporter substrate-binding protein [Anaerolineae bacterium]
MKRLLAALLMGLILFLAACAPATPQAADEVSEATESAPIAEATAEESAPAPEGSLKIALLPILDSLPYYVAAQNGYFEDAGLTVEVLPVGSGLERDQLMQSGEIDGMLNEMSSSAIFNREATQVQVVMTARKAYDDAPLFRVLAAPGSGIASPADLAGVPIGIGENTIIQYMTERVLQAEGLSAEEIVGQNVPAIPERFQLLMQGQLQAATLPDPLAQSAIEQGAVLVIDDSAHPEVAVSVLTFSSASLESKPQAVRAFLAAWSRAAEDINADPEAYR